MSEFANGQAKGQGRAPNYPVPSRLRRDADRGRSGDEESEILISPGFGPDKSGPSLFALKAKPQGMGFVANQINSAFSTIGNKLRNCVSKFRRES